MLSLLATDGDRYGAQWLGFFEDRTSSADAWSILMRPDVSVLQLSKLF